MGTPLQIAIPTEIEPGMAIKHILVGLVAIGVGLFVMWGSAEHSGGRFDLDPKFRGLGPSDATYFRNAQGLWINTRQWLVEGGKSKGVVFVSHGLGEDSTDHEIMVPALVKAGLDVYAIDHVGHGHSEGDRIHVGSFGEFSETLAQFIRDVTTERSSKTEPVFLFGHSMGGLISFKYLLDHKDDTPVTALVASSPALEIDPDAASPALLAVAKTLSTVLPKLPLKKLEIAGGLQSRDAAWVAQKVAKPTSGQGKFVTARFGAEMVGTIADVRDRLSAFDIPVLFTVGTADKLTPHTGSEFAHNVIASEDNTFKVYEDFRHCTYADVGGEQVVSDVVAWIEAHL